MIEKRLNVLRRELQDSKIDAIVIPLCDPHNSEYMADHWKKLQWISGFTGSAGTVVVTPDHAGLWSDSRYFIKGQKELEGTPFVFHKMGLVDKSTPLRWLIDHIVEGATVAMTADMWTQKQVEGYRDSLAEKDIRVSTEHDLISTIWEEDRPALPVEQLFIHDIKYACTSIDDKLSLIRQKMEAKGVAWHLITTLDDIAWTLNLRGRDVEFNPVFLAYLIVGHTESRLYIQDEKLTPEVIQHLSNANVVMKPYDEIDPDVAALTEPTLVNAADCNHALFSCLPAGVVQRGKTIPRWLKAVKTAGEIGHIANAMVKDGVALVHAFMWLEDHLGRQDITEADFVDQLAHFRSQQEGYYGESFSAIVGYNGNASSPHYRPLHGQSAQIQPSGILLCDSGGQYMDGTTDITRVIALSTPTDEIKRAYTLVLKGHISLDRARFPVGTTGGQLDVYARQPLWQHGMDFGHGTGHGVGYFLCVHEPPQGYAPGRTSRAMTALEPGMFSSNEPGYYETGQYGIRIENLVVVEEDDKEGFLKHRNLTLFPIDTTLIDRSLMTSIEIEWLNDYHSRVFAELSPHLEEVPKAWLASKCARF
ncbi:MAG: aminopeptidase P family protein [Bacteroidota bacterium]